MLFKGETYLVKNNRINNLYQLFKLRKYRFLKRVLNLLGFDLVKRIFDEYENNFINY